MAIMLLNSPVVQTVVILFAVIGVFAVMALIAMAVMHTGMMSMMDGSNMAYMCQNMLGARP